jgi:hypothetical protein
LVLIVKLFFPSLSFLFVLRPSAFAASADAPANPSEVLFLEEIVLLLWLGVSSAS